VSPFWNRRTAGLSPYIPGEQPRDRRFIKLNTNENPYPPSPRVIEALERVLAGDSGGPRGGDLRLYPDPLCGEFREAAAAAFGVKPEQVFPGNGSDEVLGFAFGAFFESEPVLFPDITYSFYPVYAGLWGIPHRTVPLRDDFSIDLRDYLPSPQRGLPGGAVIPNPNAPTGRALAAGELARAAEALEKHNRVLIVDEAYAAFGAESLTSRINDHPNLLTVHTLSKAASLAGLRVGFAIGSEELIQGLFRVRDSFNSYTMDRLALAGGAAAVLDRAYYDGVNRRVIAVRERTAAALGVLGFEVVPSRANFLFIRHRGPAGNPGAALSGAALLAALRDRGILVRRFDQPRIADYLRVSVGTEEDMDAFLAACGEITGAPGGGGSRG
jgi:histidinol-phosphate aminotransferase